jgi:hypothetical protein
MESSIDIDDVITSVLRRRADNDDEQDEEYFKSLVSFVNRRQKYNQEAAGSTVRAADSTDRNRLSSNQQGPRKRHRRRSVKKGCASKVQTARETLLS